MLSSTPNNALQSTNNSNSNDKTNPIASTIAEVKFTLPAVVVEALKAALKGNNLFSVSTDGNLYMIEFLGDAEQLKNQLVKALEANDSAKRFRIRIGTGEYDALVSKSDKDNNKMRLCLAYDDEGLQPFIKHVVDVRKKQLEQEKESFTSMIDSGPDPAQVEEILKKLEAIESQLTVLENYSAHDNSKDEKQPKPSIPIPNAPLAAKDNAAKASNDNKDHKKTNLEEQFGISSAYRSILETLNKNALPACNTNKKVAITWASGEGINKFLEQIFGNSVEVVHPNLSSINSPAAANDEEALQGAINYIKEISNILNGRIILEKPIVMPINTKSVEVKDSKNGKAKGGSHWQMVVILPKTYINPLGVKINNDKEKIFFIDSLYSGQQIPKLLEQFLKLGLEYSFEAEGRGKVTHKVPALCRDGEFINCDAPQQLGGEDCGWWAAYNAVKFVLTGKRDFLEQFKGRSRAGMLRDLFPDLDKDVVAVEKPAPSKASQPAIHPEELVAIRKAIKDSLKTSRGKPDKPNEDNKDKNDADKDDELDFAIDKDLDSYSLPEEETTLSKTVKALNIENASMEEKLEVIMKSISKGMDALQKIRELDAKNKKTVVNIKAELETVLKLPQATIAEKKVLKEKIEEITKTISMQRLRGKIFPKECVDLLKEVYIKYRNLDKKEDVIVALALNNLADVATLNGHKGIELERVRNDILSLYEKAEKLINQDKKVNDEIRISILNNYAFYLRGREQFDESGRKYEMLLKVATSLGAMEIGVLGRYLALRGIGDAYDRASNYREALTRYKEADKVLEGLLPEPIREEVEVQYLPSLWDAMANEHHHLGEYAEASELYQKAFQARKDMLGMEDRFTSASLNNLGRFYSEIGIFHDVGNENYTGAISCLEKAIEVRKKTLGERHEYVAISLKLLGDVYRDLGNYEEAKSKYLEAKAIREPKVELKDLKDAKDFKDTKQSPLSIYYGALLNSLAYTYMLNKEYTAAEATLIKAQLVFKANQDLNASDNRFYAEFLVIFGCFYYLTAPDKLRETALNYFTQAKSVVEKVFGKQHIEYVRVLNNIGEVYLRCNSESAFEYFKEATEVYQKLGSKNIYGAFIYKNLARVYYDNGKHKEAYEAGQKAIEIINGLAVKSGAYYFKIVREVADIQLLSSNNDIKKIGESGKALEVIYAEAQRSHENNYKLKLKIIDSLIHCYSQTNINEVEKWAREKNSIQTRMTDNVTAKAIDGADEKEKYYIQATLLNAMATSRTVKNGSIDISAAGKEESPLCKETWDSSNKIEREKIKANPKVKNLEFESIISKTQQEIRDLIQGNIIQAAKHAFAKAKEIAKSPQAINANIINHLIANIACTLDKGIVKEKHKDDVIKQHTSLFRDYNVIKFPYADKDKLPEIFKKFCEELSNKIKQMPKNEVGKIRWAKETAAWIEYRVNLTDHFYGDGCGKVAGVLVGFVCALANYNMPVFLDRGDYFKGSPNLPRDSAAEDLQFEEWVYYYEKRFPFTNEKSTFENALTPYFHHNDTSLTVAEYVNVNASDSKMALNPNLPGGINNHDIASVITGYTLDQLGYINEASQNLERVSKLVGNSVLNTTAYQRKDEMIRYQGHLGSTIEADFTQLSQKLLYENRNKKFDEENELGKFIKEIAFELLKNNLNISSPRDIFRTENGNTGLYNVDKDKVIESFEKFISELKGLIAKLDERLEDPKYICAVIHYRIAMTGQFFKDGNKRIALAIEAFVMMRAGHDLPRFYNTNDWSIAAPVRFRQGEEVYVSNLRQDARFLRWCYKYYQLFNPAPEWHQDVKYIAPTEPWQVMTQGATNRQMVERQTIYDSKYILQDAKQIARYKALTGLDEKRIVVFLPERILLHEVIGEIATRVALPEDEKKSSENFKSKVREVIESIKKANVDFFTLNTKEVITKRFETFKSIVARKVKEYVSIDGNSDQVSKLISKFKKSLAENYQKTGSRMRADEEEQVLVNLVSWELLRNEYQVKIEKMVHGLIENYIAKLNLLSMRSEHARTVWVLAGGPASGKTSIFNSKIKPMLARDGLIDACNINPDNFKPLLLDEHDKEYRAVRTHEESSHVKDIILRNVSQMLVTRGNAPDMILDIVNPVMRKFEMILTDNPKINLYVTTCLVEKTDRVFGAVNRAFTRAERGDASINSDFGRYVPTSVVLSGHKDVSKAFPSHLQDSKFSLIEVYDTHVEPSIPPKNIGKRLAKNSFDVESFLGFIQFARKAEVNEKAFSVDTAYDYKELSSGKIVSLLSDYLKLGIIINHCSIDGRKVYTSLSWMGVSSPNIAQSLDYLTKDFTDKDKAKAIFEEMLVSTIKRFSFINHGLIASQKSDKRLEQKGMMTIPMAKASASLLPIKLHDEKGMKLSIFSNGIVKYLSGGVIYRFLEILTSTFLQEKGIVMPQPRIAAIYRNVLVEVVSIEPRDQDKIINQLPSIIEGVMKKLARDRSSEEDRAVDV